MLDCLHGHQPQAQLYENDDELSLHCHDSHLLLRIQLTHPDLETYSVQAWLRLGLASLAHFKGSLARCPVTGHLWLVQCLPRDCSQSHLLNALEALLNQRDTWRRIVARQTKPGRMFQASTLRKPLL
ncbi:type III secretion protein [Pseudomonas syringae]|uniref:type III secretion protein n=1 Tax=Pseudomonas syringae TaxID=317 RepID=UPI001F28A60E|nr:type III secretion protein [Pseudomonas syringae]MCF5721596.1 type III secretion protein [Pseudomonas syringae]